MSLAALAIALATDTARAALTWSADVTVTNTDVALTNYQMLVTVDTATLIAGEKMQSDGDDIRFVAQDNSTLLPHWIESGIDTASTRIWVKVASIPASSTNTIYMYCGDPLAGRGSDIDATMIFGDDFVGSTIDWDKWIRIDPANGIYQDNDLVINDDGSDGWNTALIAKTNFTRSADMKIYVSMTIPADTPGNNYFMLGWELDQTSNASYTQLAHGMYINNYTFRTYEKGGSTAGSGSYTASTDYRVKIELKSAGALYYVKGGSYSDWYLVKDTTASPAYTDTPLRVAFCQSSHQANIHNISVQKYATVEPTNAVGTFVSTNKAGTLSKLVFTTAAQVVYVDEPSGVVTVTLRDDLDLGANAPSNIIVNLSSTSSSGEFSVLSSPWSTVTQVTIPSGSNSTSFYYKDFVVGTCDVAVSASPYNGATQQVVVADIHYVNAAATNPVSPYTSWYTAAADIQSAASVAADNDMVLVTNGVYAGSGTEVALITNNIIVKSVNGPTNTIIRPVVLLRRGMQINASAPDAVISGFTFNDANMNTHVAGYYGAAIYMTGGTVTNCIFDDNYTRGQGGAIWMNAGLVTHCAFITNHCDEWQYGYGGAIFLTGSGAVKNSTFHNNYTFSRRGGSAIYMNSGSALIENCLFYENEGRRNAVGSDSIGGAVWMSAGTIESCTMADNSCPGPGGGLYMTGGDVNNTVVYNNTVVSRTDQDYINVYKSGGTFTYSCTTPLQGGTGNVYLDPEFVDRTNDDYDLGSGSSCMDVATNVGLTADIYGRSRPLDADGVDGAGYDIGCIEADVWSNRDFTCTFTSTNVLGLTSITSTFDASVIGADTNVTYFWWDFNTNGAPAMTVEGPGLWSVTTNFNVGYYSVSLTVSNSSGEVTNVVKTMYIRVLPTTLYVSPSGAHVDPYDTWANAATDILSAVSAAYAPAGADITVSVTSATYSITAEIPLIKGVAVRSTDGPDNTIVQPIVNGIRSFNMTHSNAVVDGFTIRNADIAHGSGKNGGGVYMTAGLVTNCYFYDNTVKDQGGGVFISAGLVVDCVFTNNKADEWQYGYGGGARMTGGMISHSYFSHNSMLSRQGGGGVSMSGGVLRNCIIVTNKCTRSTAGSEGNAGGLRVYGGVVENCTIADNYSYGPGGGVYMSAGAITNTIIYHNTVSGGFPSSSRNLYKTGGVITHSCTTPSEAGTGNTSLDPEFQDRLADDYTIKGISPCLDTGTNMPWMIGAFDYGGSNRIIGASVDMGAYEAPDPANGPFICNFSAPTTEGFTNLVAVFTATVAGSDTNINWYWWDFDNDGSTDYQGSNAVVATNTFTSGYYDVLLTVSNSSSQVTNVLKLSYISVAPSTIYVATNGSAVPPYMTWGTAANTVDDALGVASSSDTDQTLILVSNGTYVVGTQINVAKYVTIRGFGGKANVIIKSTGTPRCFNMSHSNAILTDLTMTGVDNSGAGYHGGGVYMTAGTVTNCVLVDNRVGAKGGGIRMSGGYVTDCTFTNNRCTEWQYGYGGALYISGGLAENCVFNDNWTSSHQGGGAIYLDGGVVRNCLLINNRGTRTNAGSESDGGGALVKAGTLINCTVANNWAVKDGGGLKIEGSASTVTNCIIYYNTATTGAQDIDNPVRIGYSCSPDLTDGVSGNVTNMPMFINTNTVNYRLKGSSPCFNTGTNLSWMVDYRDLDDSLRIQHDIVDMGAYEAYIVPPGTIHFFR